MRLFVSVVAGLGIFFILNALINNGTFGFEYEGLYKSLALFLGILCGIALLFFQAKMTGIPKGMKTK